MNLITIVKSSRGKNPRDISFQGIGKYTTKTVNKETDEAGNSLGKDSEGKLITRAVEVQELETAGILTSLEDALELVGGNTQVLLNNFAIGFNANAYRVEADKDELSAFMVDIAEDRQDAVKRAIRALAKAMDLPLEDAATVVLASKS